MVFAEALLVVQPSLAYVGSHVIGSEVNNRQPPQVVAGEEHGKDERQECNDPFVFLANEVGHQPELIKRNDGEDKQDDVFPEGLPIAQLDCIAEAAAIRYRVIEGQPKRQRRHNEHETDCGGERETPANAEEQVNTHQELHDGKHASQHKRQPLRHRTGQPEGCNVVFYLVLRASRVNEFDCPREQERQTQNQPNQVYRYLLYHLLLSKRQFDEPEDGVVQHIHIVCIDALADERIPVEQFDLLRY